MTEVRPVSCFPFSFVFYFVICKHYDVSDRGQTSFLFSVFFRLLFCQNREMPGAELLKKDIITQRIQKMPGTGTKVDHGKHCFVCEQEIESAGSLLSY